MKVRMLVGISGGRGDGTMWPPPGGIIEVDDAEGAHLCAGRMAVPVTEGDAETPQPDTSDIEVRSVTAAVPKPIVNSPKAAWVDYAAANGFDPAEAAAMTKADLISALKEG